LAQGPGEKHLPDGSLELTFPVANFAEVAMEVLKHGSGVEVIEPESLRRLIEAEAEKILKLYNKTAVR
jgi:predicted DNA-binding transcriptional regulator YafY